MNGIIPGNYMCQGFLFSVVLPLIDLLEIIPRAMKFLLYLSSALLFFGRQAPQWSHFPEW